MKSVVVIVLLSLVTLAAGVEVRPSAIRLLSSSLQSSRFLDDLLIIENYLNSCPPALAHVQNCFIQNNHNPFPVGDAETCRMSMIELNCFDGAFAANDTTCPGEQAAIDASRRIRPIVVEICSNVGSSSTYTVASFFTVISMACVNLLR